MANVTVLSSCVQGLSDVITLTGSTVVPLASAINVIQVGTGYFYAGAVVDSSVFGDQSIIDTLVANNAISAGSNDLGMTVTSMLTTGTTVMAGATAGASAGM